MSMSGNSELTTARFLISWDCLKSETVGGRVSALFLFPCLDITLPELPGTVRPWAAVIGRKHNSGFVFLKDGSHEDIRNR